MAGKKNANSPMTTYQKEFHLSVTASTEVKYSPWIRPQGGLMSLERL